MLKSKNKSKIFNSLSRSDEWKFINIEHFNREVLNK